MVFKKNLSLSHSVLKVPVDRGSRAFPAGAKARRRFTSLSQNLHRTSPARCESGVKAMWKQIPDADRPKRLCTGRLHPIGERWNVFFENLSRARQPRAYIIYAPKTDWYLCVLACPSHETAVPVKKWYDFSKSGTTFQKVLPLFRISAVPTAVSAVPAARNAHPAHGSRFLL